MHQLLYVSQSHNDSQDCIDDILEKARVYNTAANITGILINKKNTFVQFLEGDYDDIIKLYGRICTDPRHGNITTLYFQKGDEKIFTDWTMAHRTEEDFKGDILEQVKLLLKMTNPKNEELSKTKIMKLLKGIRYTL